MSEKTQFFIHGSHHRANGAIDTCWTQAVQVKDAPMAHHLQGLTFTATGYGSRIPTRHMIKFNGKWRRVYCRIYSNSGTCYIGKLPAVGERLIVQEFGGKK
jgi:hypothetical protein